METYFGILPQELNYLILYKLRNLSDTYTFLDLNLITDKKKVIFYNLCINRNRYYKKFKRDINFKGRKINWQIIYEELPEYDIPQGVSSIIYIHSPFESNADLMPASPENCILMLCDYMLQLKEKEIIKDYILLAYENFFDYYLGFDCYSQPVFSLCEDVISFARDNYVKRKNLYTPLTFDNMVVLLKRTNGENLYLHENRWILSHRPRRALKKFKMVGIVKDISKPDIMSEPTIYDKIFAQIYDIKYYV